MNTNGTIVTQFRVIQYDSSDNSALDWLPVHCGFPEFIPRYAEIDFWL